MASMLRVSYEKRLFFALVIYSIVMVGCFAAFQYQRERTFKAEELNIKLQYINRSLLDNIKNREPLTEDVTLSDGTEPEGLRISVIRIDGRVIYDNSLEFLPADNHLPGRPEIARAITDGQGFDTRRHSRSTGQTYFYSALRDGDIIIRTAMPYSVSLRQLLAADFGFLWVLAAITLAMCLAGYIYTHRIGLHISRLNKFASSAERGERITDTSPFPHDELGEISNNIVRLYARLQQALLERDREHRAAMRQQAEQTEIKRRLTNNINHELKTPVAAMQVCLETLVAHPGMSPEKRDEFLNRCLRANERLGNLLGDVANLTRLDDGGHSIQREKVSLDKITAEVVDELNPQAKAHGITIHNGIEGTPEITGNPQLLASVIRNLITNTIIHSGARDLRLEIENRTASRLVISVSDNGTGVEEQHLPRLFERFYRVDKGRSRLNGGTGLGLSIVRNAVLWHGGSITVMKNRHGGLRFRITLPIDGPKPAAAEQTAGPES